MARGILKPNGSFTNQKDKEMYTLTNQSSFLNMDVHKDLEVANKQLNLELFENTEELHEKIYDPNTIKYKNELLDAFRSMTDPFEIEIKGEFDYEQNPSDPQHPQKTVAITPFEK